MKITHLTLSIPPYLSTTWIHIRALYLKEKTLVVSLVDGVVIEIPSLSEEDLQSIFSAHAAFTESQIKKPITSEKQTPFHLFHGTQNPNSQNASGQNISEHLGTLRFNVDNMESFSNAFQHNSSQSNLPNFPSEILDKIASIAKIVAPLEIENMPKPEPHCNCPHCQIARAIHGNVSEELSVETAPHEQKEIVTSEDLSFENWAITQEGENLFSVVNKLDPLEKYRVFLGETVGCTCGKAGCEHIVAVLKS